MGSFGDAENERRSRAMEDAQRPARYWQRQRPTLEQLAERMEWLEQRVAELEAT